MLRRPSPHRALVFLALPWIALLALTFRASALLGMALGWALLLVLARSRSLASLSGLEARRELYPSAFEGDTVVVDVVLENRSRRAAHLVEIGDVFGPGVADRQRLLEPGPLLGARRRRLRYRTICSRDWGVYGVGPLSVATSDPLGLFHAERLVGQLDAFAVFPRVHDVGGLERLGARASLAPEEVTAGRPGQSAAYMGVRDYRPGDDLRRIHWPVTARRGTPAVKEYEVDLTPYLALFLDLERRHRAGTGRKSTLEYVVRTAGSLLWSATRRGHVMEVHGEGSRTLFVPPGRGELHLTHCLYELIRVRQDGTTPLLDVVDQFRAHLPQGSTAVLLSGTISMDLERLEEVLEVFRARGVRPLLIFVNGDSFAPIDHWALPRAQALERCEALRSVMRSRGAPGAVLEAEQELADELARPDVFGDLT